jgi:hypothetical protein
MLAIAEAHAGRKAALPMSSTERAAAMPTNVGLATYIRDDPILAAEREAIPTRRP